MRSLALASCFLVGSAFAQVPVTQAQSQDWRFAHPGATMVGGFHVKAVLDSPLVNTLIKEADKNPLLCPRHGEGAESQRFSASERRTG
jgi:hypothetical protein